MDRQRQLLLSQLKENKYYKEANWRLHLVYILSGVLQKNYEYLDNALRMMGVKLNPNDQWHITEILKASKRAIYHAEQLYKEIPNEKDGENASYIHENWVDIFYALFLKILEIGGDEDVDAKLRFYGIYKYLDQFKQHIHAPEMHNQWIYAFGKLEEYIREGKVIYDKEKLFKPKFSALDTFKGKD